MRHLFKKLIVWTLCLAMAVGMLPGLARGAKADDTYEDVAEGLVWNVTKERYEISSYAGLLEFAKIVNGDPNNSGANAILTGEIDASASDTGSTWTPIGTISNPYKGTFDGQGKIVEKLTTKDANADHVGLFGYVGNGGSVQNVTLEGGSIKGNSYVGGVAGYNYGTVSNCYNTGKVEGSGDSVGGVAGYNYGTVSNCYNTGKVEGNSDVGGVAGWNDGTVSNCYNTGAVEGSSEIGGVAGDNDGTVPNCYNTGDVKGSSEVGGVAGENKGTVSNCYNTGAVSGVLLVGGVAGTNSGELLNCYNTGKVSSENGGIVGGVAGTNNTNSKISNCYNIGEVSGPSWGAAGGVVGSNEGTVSNCYYDKTICQKGAINGSDDASNYGCTTDQMTGEYPLKSLTGFKDENGKSEWLVRENTLDTFFYPHLKGFAYDATGDVKDWPATISSGYTYELDSASFDYNGEIQKPKVTVKENGVEVDETLYKFTFVDSVNAGEYTIEFENTETHVKGVIPYTIEKRKLKITACNQKFDYLAGQTQGPKDDEYMDAEVIEKVILIGGDELADTDSLSSITLRGQQETEVGIYEDAFEPCDAEIVNNNGKEVTSNYKITYIAGNLIINPITLTLTANSGATVTYDGTAKTVSGYTCSVDGLTFDGVTAGVSATKAGTYEVTFAGVTLEKTTDTTGNYKVTKAENGTLTINKKLLTITADSDTKEFDGTALTKDSVTTTALAEGDKLESITITGTQTEVGTSDNVPSSAKIVNAAGEDVTSCYDITYVNGTLTVTKPAAPKLADDQKPAPKQDLKEDGKEQVLVLDPAKLPEGYTIEYSTDGGKTWKAAPTGSQSGEYTIEVKYTADGNHTDFFGDTLKVMIQGVYNNTESDGDWTKGSGKTYTFRIKKAFNDEVCFDNFTGILVDGKQAKAGENYTAVKGSTVITFAADYLETLSVGEHMIRVVFKDGEILLPLKILEAVATPTPAVDATPVTGDTANPFLFVALILMSMAGAAVIIERRRHDSGI